MGRFLTLCGSLKVAEKKHAPGNRHSVQPFKRNDNKEQLLERMKHRQLERAAQINERSSSE